MCADFDRYEVSDLGRIRNRKTNAVRKLSLYQGDYTRVSLWDGQSYKRQLVHRLVARAWCRGRGPEVNHINGEKHDNRAVNLEWCTRIENVRDAWNRRPWVPPRLPGSANPSSKLTESQVLEIRRLRKCGHTLTSIAEKFEVSFGLIGHITTGRSWKHLPSSRS